MPGRVPQLDSASSAALVPRAAVPVTGSVRLRVRYGECDSMGVAHHAAYAPWLEIARTEMLREAGVTYAQLERAGIFLVVARLQISYRRPVYYDDVVEVRTRVTGGGKVKIEHEYEVVLAESGAGASQPRTIGESLTTADTVLVCVDREGRVRGLPEWLVPSPSPRGS
ncbi:MAG: acyl-CoA thioesterase [Phycisphaerales bacterium]